MLTSVASDESTIRAQDVVPLNRIGMLMQLNGIIFEVKYSGCRSCES